MQLKINKTLWILAGIMGLEILGILVWFSRGRVEAAGGNLITNPSVETASANPGIPQGWYQDFYGNNTRKFTYPGPGQEGTKGLKVELTKISSGDIKWAFNDVPVTGGQKYTFSDYYQSNITSFLVVRYLMKNGSYRYVDLATLPAAAVWTQSVYELTPPTNAKAATVYHLIKKVGWLMTDNFGLSSGGTGQPTATPTSVTLPSPTPTEIILPTATPTEVILPSPTPTEIILPSATPTIVTVPSPTPTEIILPTATPTEVILPTATPTEIIIPTPGNGGELLINGDLETADSGGSSPAGWSRGNWGTNTVNFSYPAAGHTSVKAAEVTVSQITDGDAKWYFDDIAVKADTSYQFSDYYLANVDTRIVARYALSGGGYSYVELSPTTAAAGWQSLTRILTPPVNSLSFTVFHLIDKVGSLTIDDVSVKEYTDPNILSQGMVSLDFDDGWSSTFNNGLPIIKAAGYKATLYIISGSLGGTGYMTTTQMLAAQTDGHEIGSHSKTHPQLPLLSQSQQIDEITGSRQDLLALGASPVNAFAYPYGEYNDQVVSVVKSSGYTAARTALVADSGYNSKTTDHHLLKTFSVESTTTVAEIESWIDTAIKTKTWVILTMHQVDNTGGQYSITMQNLQSVVDYLTTKQVKVVTVSEGLQEIN